MIQERLGRGPLLRYCHRSASDHIGALPLGTLPKTSGVAWPCEIERDHQLAAGRSTRSTVYMISVERFESVAPSYARAGYFLGLNGHIRAHVKSHPDWSKEDYVKLAHQFVEMEIEAHPDLAGPPISELEIDENGDVHWLDKGACDSREFGGAIRAKMEK